MKHTLLTLAATALLALASPQTLSAQQVQTAIGGRVGSPFGLSAKYFLTEEFALEGVVSLGLRNFQRDFAISGAGLYHFDIDFGEPELEPLKLYAGAGAGISLIRYRNGFFVGSDPRDDRRAAALNLRGYIGLQYAFEDVPLELTIDTGPGIYAGRVYDTFYVHYSLGVRYILDWQ